MSLTVYVLYQHVYAPVSADSEQDAHVLMTPHGGFIHASSLMSTCASRLGRDFASSDPFSVYTNFIQTILFYGVETRFCCGKRFAACFADDTKKGIACSTLQALNWREKNEPRGESRQSAYCNKRQDLGQKDRHFRYAI
ncbi:hypothetical protein DTO280E4_4384 [Paecilomyces variotii]|nr:hypothetical protein DTO280E4_4384 [Paecilomyces variotii]